MHIKTRGFTLVEISIVLTIIAILAALLFPVLFKAREKSRQATCANNQRQIAMSIIMAAQERDEKFSSAKRVWSDIALPQAMLHCPDTRSGVANSYVYNNILSNLSLGELCDASATMVTADGNPTAADGQLPNVAYSCNDLALRHEGATLVAFADGHTELIKNASPWLKVLAEDFERQPKVTLAEDGLHDDDSTVAVVKEKALAFDGGKCLEVNYNIPAVLNSYVAAQFDDVSFYTPIHRISFMAHGDGSGNELVLRLLDANGEVFQYSSSSIITPKYFSYTGWREVNVNLDAGANLTWALKSNPNAVADGKIQYPVKLWQILVERTRIEAPSTGKILIDNLYAWSGNSPEATLAP